MENVLDLIGLIIIALGVICIYDARELTKKFFSTSDINESAKTIKIVGFIVSVIGGILVFI